MSKSKSKQESIDHDQLFKQLLTTFFVEFLELFTPEFFAAIDPSSEQQFQVEVDTIKLPKERQDVMEITTSWMEEGIIKGERALTIRLLTKKVGNLSPELLARVSSLNLERVEVLAEDLLDFKHVGDLERWMGD